MVERLERAESHGFVVHLPLCIRGRIDAFAHTRLFAIPLRMIDEFIFPPDGVILLEFNEGVSRDQKYATKQFLTACKEKGWLIANAVKRLNNHPIHRPRVKTDARAKLFQLLFPSSPTLLPNQALRPTELQNADHYPIIGATRSYVVGSYTDCAKAGRGLGIPDYFKVVKEPVDLTAIVNGIDSGAYTHFSQVYHHVLLVFKNAMDYNPPENPIHQLALKVRASFASRAMIFMHQLQGLPAKIQAEPAQWPPPSSRFLLTPMPQPSTLKQIPTCGMPARALLPAQSQTEPSQWPPPGSRFLLTPMPEP
eukprot:gene18199-24641_t